MSYSNINFYQSSQADADDIKRGFLVRLAEYDIIFSDILHNPMEGSVQHYLLLGRRGSGKSTLLRRLQIEIDEKLDDQYIAINTPEEQANLYRLSDLLHHILQELEDRCVTVEWPGEDDNEHRYNRTLFSTLHSSLQRAGKKVILLLDNMDRIFDNIGEDSSLLREYLSNYKDIKIIGASTRLSDHFWSYKKPFYEFFRIMELRPLTSEEVKKLLLRWSEELDLPELKDFVEKKPGQLETIRMLTDGLPRTLQFFASILLRNEQEMVYDYLKLIMDAATPLYQERLNDLPPAQRKIVLQLAFLWEAAGAKELAQTTRMENRIVSAQLHQLIEKKVVEKIETDTKNHLYRLSERFFNLWLIFTQGSSRVKRKARHLTVFLENFYDAEELKDYAYGHLARIKEERLAADKAVLMTTALAQSKYISSSLKDDLITSTLKLSYISDDLKKQLPLAVFHLWDEVERLVRDKEWERAFRTVDLLDEKHYFKEFLWGLIYYGQREFEKAESNFLKMAGIMPVALDLAWLYEKWHKPEQAEKYFIATKAEGNPAGFATLGLFYKRQKKWALAEEYLLKAGREEGEDVELDLALVYSEMENTEMAEKYFLLAFGKGERVAAYYLAALWYAQNKNKAEALALLKSNLDVIAYDDRATVLLLIVKIWNGEFVDAGKDLSALIRNDGLYLEELLMHLLIHDQKTIVATAFADKEVGKELQESFWPLYYAAQYLWADKAKTSIRMPPEIKEAVDDILKTIKKMHHFYYGNNDRR